MSALLFDLDGTIADSAAGILASVRATLREMDVAEPAEGLDWMLGPPVGVSFARLLGGPDRAEHAVATYRRHYAEGGLAAAKPYPAVIPELRRLRRDGRLLLVCTSKLTTFAQTLLGQFGLLDAFAGVYGSKLGGEHDGKAALVARMLRELGLDGARSCMIGDRAEDIHAGSANGLGTIGVLWGYGGRRELTEAGASAICERPGDLGGALRKLGLDG